MNDAFHAGICGICGEVLDPTDPKWAHHVWPWADEVHTRRYTALEWAEILGPYQADIGCHGKCLCDAGMPEYIR